MKANLWFTVYKNINIKLFLEFNNFADFFPDEINILFLGDPEKIKITVINKLACDQENMVGIQ